MSRDVSPTMTNTNTTPNDTERTNERTRSTPRAPARALPRRALPPLSRARASVPIHPRRTGPVAFFIVASPRAYHIDRLDREYEATDRSRRFLSSRHRARTTWIVSIESTRQSATRAFAFASTSRLARLHLHGIDGIRDTFSTVVSGGILVYASVYTHGRFCVYTTYRVSVSTHRVHASPRDRPTDRPRADVEAGTNAMTRSIAHTSTRGRSRGNSVRKHRSRRSRDGRSRRDIERVVRAHAFIHSFIHSFRERIKR